MDALLTGTQLPYVGIQNKKCIRIEMHIFDYFLQFLQKALHGPQTAIS